ncbi:50S ribosomal protein L19 [Patescibacteria group bacterium]|nr:50S ribosomal protein L19 [Patescibacteria group bacterium]MBU1074517.1 50S ribosomal protein L19 [Patescibacteria group bacterium]
MTKEESKAESPKQGQGEKKEKKSEEREIPEIESGNVVKVHQKITQGDKTRTQIFEGIVIAKRGKTSADQTITVRKVSDGGYGVERIFPLESPNVLKIEVLKTPRTRRSKLYYLRTAPRKLKELKDK